MHCIDSRFLFISSIANVFILLSLFFRQIQHKVVLVDHLHQRVSDVKSEESISSPAAAVVHLDGGKPDERRGRQGGKVRRGGKS